MLTYLAIADQYKPQWIVWENVPGVLSSNGGKDFGVFLGALGELGYGFAYRILDAQYFGVAQRRRRVFVVGYLGDWRRAAAVLFERDSLQGNPAPSRKKRESIAPTIKASIGTGGVDVEHPMIVNALCAADAKGVGNQYLADHKCVVQPIALAENTIGRKPENGGNGDGFTDGGPMYTLNATGVHGVAQPIAYALDSLASNSMKSANPVSGCNEVDVSKTLDTSRGLDPSCNQGGIAVAQPMVVHGTQDPCVSDIAFAQGRNNGGENVLIKAVGTDLYNGNITGDVAATMGTPGSSSNASGPTVMQSMAVRRLTPVECERLQGFPDTYTDIKSKGKATPDGPRYKALGNSMAVPVMAWIGKRIQEVDAICKPNK
jgi:DNA (cytosine-5)-methyltransferase 1